MPRVVKLKDGTQLELEATAFASGGEGDLFRVISPGNHKNKVIKLYKQDKRTKEREQKIEYLIANSPPHVSNDGHHSIIWMKETVYEKGQFAGFSMPTAKGEKLELLCYSNLPKQLGAEWHKFELVNKESRVLRLNICFNIAVALYHIHVLGCYVLVDMKPENIMIQSNGLISLIDIDSVAVVKNGRTIFNAPVATPDYSPPEHYKKNVHKTVKESWDRFSLSVIFYRLLFGIHPFSGNCTLPFEKCVTLAEMVENGLFPHGENKKYFKIIPPPHLKFKSLDQGVQDLFMRCFSDGHVSPDHRPTAEEWCIQLSNQALVQVRRKLPSLTILFPAFIFSRPIVYNPHTGLTFPNFQFLNPTRPKGVKAFFTGLFGRSKYQFLLDEIKRHEESLKERLKIGKDFEEGLKEILNKFANEQYAIIDYEKKKVEQLRIQFNSAISNINKNAEKLFQLEAQETKLLYSNFNNKIAEIDQKIKASFNLHLAKKQEVFQQQKLNLQNQINVIISREHVDLQKALASPTKLSRYRIDQNAARIFNSYNHDIIWDLSLKGFNTMSDIVDVNSDGLLKNRSNQWIKVPGVATVRAKALNKFRMDMAKKEDEEIKRTIHYNYIQLLSALRNKLLSFETQYKLEITGALNLYNKDKAGFEIIKGNLINDYNESHRLIKEKYDHLHQPILNEGKNLVTIYVSKLNQVSIESSSELCKNHQEKITEFAKKKQEVNFFIKEIVQDIEIIKQLHLNALNFKK